MNVATKRPPSERAARKPRQPRILLFGDSHSHAVQRAIEKRNGKGQRAQVSVHRLSKMKNGKQVGDTSLEEFMVLAKDLRPDDVVVSMIGGNQHSILSLIQHPQPFDFFTRESGISDSSVEVIPYRALESLFVKGLGGGDGKSLKALRKSTSAHVVHVIPPPPKRDNAFIRQYHETNFARDLPNLGVSPPELRLKFWKLQTRILEQLCAELGVEVMMPPRKTVDEDGYLRPEYYAQDATHGNWRYGERVLRALEDRYVKAAAGARV